MNVPPDRYDLHRLEVDVRTELTFAEMDEPDLGAGIVGAEPVSGPEGVGFEEITYEETERYEAGLRSLLGAIESVETELSDMDSVPNAPREASGRASVDGEVTGGES